MLGNKWIQIDYCLNKKNKKNKFSYNLLLIGEIEMAKVTKEFENDLTFLLIKHYGSNWEYNWDEEENSTSWGFNMSVSGWSGSRVDPDQKELPL